ncbi:MAG: hypothetical protein AB1486_33940 [Planctomycetota bacterium]
MLRAQRLASGGVVTVFLLVLGCRHTAPFREPLREPVAELSREPLPDPVEERVPEWVRNPSKEDEWRWEDHTAVQVLLGAAFLGDDDLEFESRSSTDPSLKAETDLSTMPLIGAFGQLPFAGSQTQVGMEAGLLFSWWRDSARVVAAGGGTAFVELDTSLVLFDFSAGAYVSSVLWDKLRVYAGAGPLLMFGYLDSEDEQGDAAGSVSVDETDSTFGVGGYARTGIELRLPDRSFIGLGMRWLRTELDFSSDLEEVDIDGLQFGLTYTKGF